MNTYLQHHYDAADETEQVLFQDLLQEQDPDIMAMITEPDSNPRYRSIIRKIRHTLGTAD